nr:hypothetical protein [Nitrospirota bacterium]
MTYNDYSTRRRRLHESVALCPTDLAARCELAECLEAEGATDDALLQWQQVLAHNPNSLKAWEGMARCRAGAPNTAHPSVYNQRR